MVESLVCYSESHVCYSESHVCYSESHVCYSESMFVAVIASNFASLSYLLLVDDILKILSTLPLSNFSSLTTLLSYLWNTSVFNIYN